MKLSKNQESKYKVSVFSLGKNLTDGQDTDILKEKEEVPELFTFKTLVESVTDAFQVFPNSLAPDERPEMKNLEAYIAIGSKPEIRTWQDERRGFSHVSILGKIPGAKASEFHRAGKRYIKFLQEKKVLCVHSLQHQRFCLRNFNSTAVYVYILIRVKRNCKVHESISKNEIRKYAHQLEYCLEEGGLKLKGSAGWLQDSLMLMTKAKGQT